MDAAGAGGGAARRVVAVIGTGADEPRPCERARAVGRLLAGRGCVVATGGLGGVMAAAARGAREAGGLVLGILPGASPAGANPYVDLAVATGAGDARNAILCNTAEAFVAVGGSYGTLSEIALALKRGKRVVALDSWEHEDLPVLRARTPEEAVALALGD